MNPNPKPIFFKNEGQYTDIAFELTAQGYRWSENPYPFAHYPMKMPLVSFNPFLDRLNMPERVIMHPSQTTYNAYYGARENGIILKLYPEDKTVEFQLAESAQSLADGELDTYHTFQFRFNR